MDLLSLYKLTSGVINDNVARGGEIAIKTASVRGLRTIKKEILKLIDIYVKKAEDLENFYVNFIPPLFDAMLGDFKQNVAGARDAEVLNVLSTIISVLRVSLTSFFVSVQ